MDHHHLMLRPKLANRVMQEVARNLAGLGTLPDTPPSSPTRTEHHVCDALVIGGGPSGRAAAAALVEAGFVVEHVERFDALATSSPAERSRCDTSVFGIYPGEHARRGDDHGGRVAAIERSRAGTVLHTFTPRHLVLATGTRDVMLPLPDNDVPGVLAARGLLALLGRIDGTLAVPAVVVGDDEHAERLAAQLGAQRFEVAEVEAVLGGSRVDGIATRRGKLDVGIVAIAAPPAPASELARHAGATVRYDGHGFPVERDADGRCAQAGWTAWACGELAGVSASAAADDGARVGANIVAALREEARP